MTRCIICGKQSEPMFEAPADPWCGDCYDLEIERHNAEDRKGTTTIGGLGIRTPTFSRPPMYMLPQSRWHEHNYTMDTVKGFKKRQAEREAKREADKEARQKQKAADHERRLEDLRNSRWVTG